VQFTLRTLLVFFVFVAAGLGTFGGWGIIIVAWCVAVVAYARRRLFWAVLLFVLPAFLTILLLPAISAPREAGRRAHCLSRLKQIGIALHNYHDQHGAFPPAWLPDENGKPAHSWRILILPYLGEDALYRAYRFDEPWDGPNNSKLAAQMPFYYRCPSDYSSDGTGMTSYVAVVGPETAWPAPDRSGYGDFVLDGLAHTLMVVETTDSGIHWMEPRDLTMDEVLAAIEDPKDLGKPGIRSYHADAMAYVGYADGSVRFLDLAALDRDTLRAHLTRAGGERVDFEALDRASRSLPLSAAPQPRRRTPFVFFCSLAVFLASGVLLLWMTERGGPSPVRRTDRMIP
jgi:hypothetical protein